MSEEDREQINFLLEYLKNEENTRRIKTITISEAELLINYIQQKENIIKEVREYVETHYLMPTDKGLLEILDKGDKGE